MGDDLLDEKCKGRTPNFNYHLKMCGKRVDHGRRSEERESYLPPDLDSQEPFHSQKASTFAERSFKHT